MANRDKKPQGCGLQILRAEGNFPGWLVHGFSTRVGGCSDAYGGKALNLGFTRADTAGAVHRNRAALLQELGCGNGQDGLWPLVTLRQVHSDVIHTVEGLPKAPPKGDGLITSMPGLLLGVETADCLPILLVDRKQKVVGAFHAGWRGTLARIVEKGMGNMRREFGSMPADVCAAIGPGIGACCYAVGDEVGEKFESQFAYAADLFREVVERDPVREKYPLLFLNARAPGHGDFGRRLHLDLVEANRRQLLSAGVKPGNIAVVAMCTSCRNDLFFSYRSAQGPTGRQMGVVGIRPQ